MKHLLLLFLPLPPFSSLYTIGFLFLEGITHGPLVVSIVLPKGRIAQRILTCLPAVIVL